MSGPQIAARRSSATAPAQADAIGEALAEVWQRNRGLACARVATIERAALELSKDPVDAAVVEAGRAEAHKLAGVLGTFGLGRGTDLARCLEEHLTAARANGEAVRLQRAATELRGIVEAAPPSPGA